MTAAELAARAGARPAGTGRWLARCPAHDDRNPSLSVWLDDEGRVGVKCHAGCDTNAVLAALGLTRQEVWPARRVDGAPDFPRDGREFPTVAGNGKQRNAPPPSGLTLAQLAAAKQLPAECLRALGLADDHFAGRPAVRIPYLDAAGKPLATRYRVGLEGDRFRWAKGDKAVPYGLERLAAAREAGWLLVVEGESDCWTLWHAGLPALGIPGKGAWKDEWAAHLTGLAVYVWQEPDAADFSARLGKRLPEARVIVAPAGIKDPSEAHLQGKDLAAFLAALRQGARPVAEVLPAAPDEPERRKPSQATRLLTLAAGFDLFHSTDAVPRAFATVPRQGHAETWEVRSSQFRRLLLEAFWQAEGTVPAAQAVADALGALEARACCAGPRREVALRVCGDETRLYLDLADDEWRCVEVTGEGWRLLAAPPAGIAFRRTPSTRPLPVPQPGGCIEELRPLVNAEDDDSWRLAVAWLLMALHPAGPYPVLTLYGEQGTAKSTTARLLRGLIDPAGAPLRAEPSSAQDLAIAARNTRVVCYDNLSYVPGWLSDALCRLSTGGGFATRQLYTNDEEVVLDALRPVLLTGIEEVVTRGDLQDRSLVLTLAPIAERERRPESAIEAHFRCLRPRVLGALLDAVACAIRHRPDTTLPRLPRLADFALWVTAAEPALGWEAGTFIETYERNRARGVETVLDADPLARYLRALADEGWRGTATDLLAALTERADEGVTRARNWPKAANKLSGRVRRLAPALRAVGVAVEEYRQGGTGERLITIERVAHQPSLPSLPSPTPQNPNHGAGSGGDDHVTVHAPGDDPIVTPALYRHPPEGAQTGMDAHVFGGRDDCDGSDDHLPTLSGGRVRGVL